MSSSFVSIDFSNLDKILRKLTKNMYVDVGILQPSQYPDKDVNTASVGAVHEFGAPERNIPERSFIKMPLEMKKKVIEAVAQQALDENIGKDKTEKVLDAIGETCCNIIQQAFDSGGFGRWEQLSEETVRRKGFDDILTDTEALRDDIQWQVKGKDIRSSR